MGAFCKLMAALIFGFAASREFSYDATLAEQSVVLYSLVGLFFAVIGSLLSSADSVPKE